MRPGRRPGLNKGQLLRLAPAQRRFTWTRVHYVRFMATLPTAETYCRENSRLLLDKSFFPGRMHVRQPRAASPTENEFQRKYEDAAQNWNVHGAKPERVCAEGAFARQHRRKSERHCAEELSPKERSEKPTRVCAEELWRRRHLSRREHRASSARGPSQFHRRR